MTTSFTSEEPPGRPAPRLASLLDHLQGNSPAIGADAGLARLGSKRLQSIRDGARIRAADCLRDLQNVARLLAVFAASDEVSDELRLQLSATSEQFCRLADDALRWQELSDNAAYYGGNPAVASNVAQLWSRWAAYLEEWPGQETKTETPAS